MLELKGLTCGYGRFVAVRDLSFTVRRGEAMAVARRQRRRQDLDPDGDRRPGGGPVGRHPVRRRGRHGALPHGALRPRPGAGAGRAAPVPRSHRARKPRRRRLCARGARDRRQHGQGAGAVSASRRAARQPRRFALGRRAADGGHRSRHDGRAAASPDRRSVVGADAEERRHLLRGPRRATPRRAHHRADRTEPRTRARHGRPRVRARVRQPRLGRHGRRRPRQPGCHPRLYGAACTGEVFGRVATPVPPHPEEGALRARLEGCGHMVRDALQEERSSP